MWILEILNNTKLQLALHCLLVVLKNCFSLILFFFQTRALYKALAVLIL